jgi:outer membrane protein assembly factor BamA
LNENVIDRTIKLISFGDGNQIMLYPTMNLAPGTGSSTGLTVRDQALFGRRTERAVMQGILFVNGDWKYRGYMTASDIAGTGFTSKLSLSLTRVKNTSANQPGTPSFWFFADTSTSFSATISHLIIEKVALKGTFVYRDNNYGSAPPQADTLRSGFFRNEAGVFDPRMRGLDDSWTDRILAVGVSRDSRNNQNIVLAGSDFNATYHYHFTSAHHDFQGWESSLTNYFQLGKNRYEISTEEERKSGGISLKKVLEKMDIENLKKELFNRKVLVTHLYSAQVFEIPGNHMPVYGLQTLGNDTPMRGYGGSRFRDYTVLSAGAEYRFPIMRLVDGVIFDEYGVYGRSWDKIEYLDNLKNSWGFGIRVRRPDIYLFRLQLGFHGLHGIQLNMSVDEPY